MKLGERRIWSNSLVTLRAIHEEKERRRSTGIQRPWGEVMETAILEQLDERESQEILYVDHEGRYWDEVSHKPLDPAGVISASKYFLYYDVLCIIYHASSHTSQIWTEVIFTKISRFHCIICKIFK